jgi:hypothetical protein
LAAITAEQTVLSGLSRLFHVPETRANNEKKFRICMIVCNITAEEQRETIVELISALKRQAGTAPLLSGD